MVCFQKKNIWIKLLLVCIIVVCLFVCFLPYIKDFPHQLRKYYRFHILSIHSKMGMQFSLTMSMQTQTEKQL